MRAFLALLASLLFAGLACAQSYPSRSVKVIVPWPPGQATDIAARLVAQKLQDSLGQPFVIDNEPGAGGSIGSCREERARRLYAARRLEWPAFHHAQPAKGPV